MKCAGGSKVEEKGQWIGEGLLPGWKCSICGEHIVLDVFRWGKFCPNCGHPMEKKVIVEEPMKKKVIVED